MNNWHCASTLIWHFSHVNRVFGSSKSPTGLGEKKILNASSIVLENLISNKISLNSDLVVET